VSTTSTPLPGGRLGFLDALRGLAALYVVVYHMVLIPEPDLALPYWAGLIAHNGGMGVTLFFVVSAFSLFYTMPLRLREPSPWLSFFAHRFFRIAPLFYAWIVLTMIRDCIVFDASHSFGQILASATFAFNMVPQGQEGFVWASWTIGIEMLFYAVFPLYFMLARDRGSAVAMTFWLLIGWIVVQALLAYFPAIDPETRRMFLQWSFLRHLPVFACGAIAYHCFVPGGKVQEQAPGTGAALIAISVFLFTALINGWLPNIFGDLYYWQALVFTSLLLGLGWCPLRMLVNRVTAFLGRISYSLYLGHPTVILLLGPIYAWIYRHGWDLSISFLACLLITLGAAILVAEVTFRLIETPGIEWGKKLNRWLRDRQRVASAT